jgi:hypothetical protein
MPGLGNPCNKKWAKSTLQVGWSEAMVAGKTSLVQKEDLKYHVIVALFYSPQAPQ